MLARVSPAAAEFRIDEDILTFLVHFALHGKGPAAAAAAAAAASAPKPAEDTTSPAPPPPFKPTLEHVLSLVSHVDQLGPKFLKDIRDCAATLFAGVAVPESLDPCVLVGIIKANAHGDSDGLICGMFPGLAMLCHSCEPNCVYQIKGRVTYVRAARDIAKGEEVTISYLQDLCSARRRRQRILLDERFFRCTCPRCAREEQFDPLEAFHCSEPSCDGLVSVPLEKEESAKYRVSDLLRV